MDSHKSKQSFYQRFLLSWKPSLLQTILKEKDSKSVWKYWFILNTIIVGIFVVIFRIGFVHFSDNFSVQEILNKVNTPNFEIYMTESGIEMSGIEDPKIIPLFQEGSTEKTFLFGWDTQELEHTVDILDDYKAGIFIGKHELTIKESDFSRQIIPYHTILNTTGNKNIKINPETLQIHIQWFLKSSQNIILLAVILFALLYYIGIRLISALLWAFFVWMAAKVWIPQSKMTFKDSYMSILSVYHIPLLFEFIFFLNGVWMPFTTFLIFVLVFGMNFYEIRKTKK